jgi:Na+-transporting methylmalonyl-CoA/oxaloacetate decarboxylase gamma subunit
VRRIVVVVCLGAIAGMIATSIADSTGAAITFGLVAAVAVVCLILVTATAGPAAFAGRVVDDEATADVERRVRALTATGVDEPELRALVRAARRMERRSPG